MIGEGGSVKRPVRGVPEVIGPVGREYARDRWLCPHCGQELDLRDEDRLDVTVRDIIVTYGLGGTWGYPLDEVLSRLAAALGFTPDPAALRMVAPLAARSLRGGPK